jgi:branched-chain amino acid transport system ATP-binding protein
MSHLLELRHLDKRFGGIHVTRDVSFRLAPGDRLALIGPNGAGKTTLVNQISGVFPADSGEIWLRGENVSRLSQAQRVRAGLARTFQITTLAPHFPVQRQIELALFEREGLGGCFWRGIDSFPALQTEARALLDEPMAGVPKGDGERLLAALDALPRDLAVLIIEHDMDLVFRFASRILVLAEGAVLADGTPDEIRRDPLVRAAYLGHGEATRHA